jgi:hypothetical protein
MTNYEACNTYIPFYDIGKAPEMKLIGYMDVINASENPREAILNTEE